MDGKMLARLLTVAFVAVAITATAIEMTRKEEQPELQSARMLQPARPDPLRGELIRCQLLGETGSRDFACLRAWAENRKRFLAAGARPAEHLPSAPAETQQAETPSEPAPSAPHSEEAR